MSRKVLEPRNLAIKTISVAIVGGIAAVILSALLGAIEPMFVGFGALMSGIIALAIIIALAKSSNIDDMTFVGVLVLLFAVSLVGSIIALALPMVSPYILTVTDFTLSGLIWTVAYVMIAESVLNKVL